MLIFLVLIYISYLLGGIKVMILIIYKNFFIKLEIKCIIEIWVIGVNWNKLLFF